MGLFKDMHTLNKQAKEIEKNWDPKAMRANAMDRMKSAQEMMAQQTAAANISATGMPATASITAVSQPGGMVNYEPIIEVEMTVFPPSGAPYPATVSAPMPPPLTAKLAPGASLQVKVDPQNPQTVWIDPTS